MGHIHTTHLTDADVRDIALPILHKRLERYGFSAFDAREEEDFDGSYVLRMTAHVKERVPARELIEAVNDIHAVLRRNGDPRYVFLSTKRPGDQEADEDLE